MQSFAQYRRFGKAVEHQLQRRKERPAGFEKDDDGRRISHSQSSTYDADPEKASVPSPSFLDAPSDRHTDHAQEAVGRRPLDRRGVQECEEVEQPLDDEPTSRVLEPSASRQSQRSQSTVGTRLGQTLTGIDVRRKTTDEGNTHNNDDDEKVFVVSFEGDHDPLNPHNWSFLVRVRATFFIALIAFIVGYASSTDSEVLKPAAAEFGVSMVTESLATGLFLSGFGFGALVAGPISETVGRNPVYIVTLGVYMMWIMASALSPNIGSQLVFRFLAGFFGSTPLTCAGGSIADLWNPLERVWAFPIFANAAFTGPVIGPVVGGWIAQSPLLSWRWTEWITLIWSGLIFVIILLFQPETFSGVILQWKAQHLRRITGERRFVAPIEVRADTLWHRLGTSLYRPFIMTAREPIIILVALYLTVIYIILFTFLDGYDYIFSMNYGIGEGLTGTCFLGIVIGLFLASGLVPLIYKWAKQDLAKIKEQGGDRLPPEFRLWYSMLGGSIAIPVSLFWMGWTARPSISIWSPLVASVLLASYIIDSYEIYAASALASVTLIRYVAAGGMVVVGIPFYENLGVAYTLTILACLSAVLVPVPYLFYFYGAKLRKRSNYAPDGKGGN